MIPSRAQSFQDRAEAGQLRAAVDDDAVSCQVLTGMGGVGKTQLAADYAHTAWGNGGLDVLVWVTATSRPSVVASYAQAGVELCGADPKDPDRAARAFLAWLTPKTGQTPCRWLIVLDDIADPGDLNATSEGLDSRHSLWPPASPHGRTLATTRRRDAALTRNARPPIKVGLFTPDEAATYLTTSLAAHSRNEPADHLATLARDLGRLPLALSQATAYIIDAAISVDCVPCPHNEGECPSYRALLADRVTALVDLAPDVLPDEQGVALAAAWSLSIERADRLRPVGLARPMLQLAALLDANGIPQDVLTGEAARDHLAAHRIATSPCPAEEPAPVSRQDAVRALRALDRLSLIAHTSDTPHKTVRVHQLIQRATRDTLTSDQRVHHARTAADALSAAWPEIEQDTTLAQVLRANTDALTRHAEDALWYPDAHAVLFRAGESLGRSGQVADAVSHARYLAATARQRLGPDHPDALIARNNLAYWRGEAGDPAGAAEAFADLLSDRTRILGWGHPHTMDTVVNLSHWQARAGHTRSAGLSFFAFYGVCLDKLGPEHARTRSALSHLATWSDESGNLAGAADMFAELVDICLRTVGPDNLETLSARRNLARVRGEAGDAAGAAGAFAALLTDCLRTLGNGHPESFQARDGLARWRGKAGDAAGAADAFAELLGDHTRIMGPDHPVTFAIRNNLAHWRGEAGDAAGAADALAELFTDCLRVLGAGHSFTLAVFGNLCSWHWEAGNGAEAITTCAAFLEDCRRALGPEHRHTLTARHDLDHYRGLAGADGSTD